ncbi:MAG: outer membrane beta-barrel protein [Cyclobacteriaceae bacterium]
MICRKYFMFAAAFLLNFSLAKGQILTGPMLGAQATTVGYSSLYEGLDFSQNLSFNYLGGWSYTYEVNEVLAFHSELLFSQKGKVQGYHSSSTRVLNHQTHFQFLDAPVMLRITQPLNRKGATWFINAGPQVSYWLGGKGTINAYEFFGSPQQEELTYKIRFNGDELEDGVLIAQDANRVQFGLALGGGIGLPVNREGHQVMINVRYIMGTTLLTGNESFPVGTSDIEEYLSYKHNVLQLSTAYVFPVNLLNMRRGKSTKRIKHRK